MPEEPDWEALERIYVRTIAKMFRIPPDFWEKGGKMNKFAVSQPDPHIGQEDVADQVLLDIKSRIQAGLIRYGTKLQTFNGRDALWDAYQEAIDLVMYLRQAIMERDKEKKG